MTVIAFSSHAPYVASRTSRIISATIFLLLVGLIAHYSDFSQRLQFVKSSFTSVDSVQAAKASTRQFLPLEDAQETCSRRRLDVYSNRNETRKVYDIFMINTELDLLEIRLGELHEQVDYFVVVESKTTFVGDEKPMYLKEHWERFKPFHDQIIYKEIDLSGIQFEDPWARERFHRDSMYSQIIPFLEGKQKANLDDILIVSVRKIHSFTLPCELQKGMNRA